MLQHHAPVGVMSFRHHHRDGKHLEGNERMDCECGYVTKEQAESKQGSADVEKAGGIKHGRFIFYLCMWWGR